MVTVPSFGSRWLAAVTWAETPTDGAAPDGFFGGREQISRQLIDIGRAPAEAQDAASRLTAEDLEVLLANPEMIQAAGGAQTHMAIGILLVVALIVALAAAGGSVVIISST
ncbi:MAG: hypothetical protein ACYSUF_08895 [Planctomycetota bacterium]|jgi:hypothetical protein